MKILFIFTGGTIGSTLSDGVMYADAEKPYKLLHAYKERHGIAFDYDTAEPYLALSENNTGAQLGMLLDCVQKNLHAGYDGIVITHGTDTLQYSAAAVGYAVGLAAPPICLVSSQKPIEAPDANGLANLHAAICFISERAGQGAFVLYRNPGAQTVQVHRATRLLGSIAYTDHVMSVGDQAYGWMEDARFVKNPDYREQNDAIAPISNVKPNESAPIWRLTAHPGMQYPDDLSGVRAVLLDSYHSGTVDTASTAALSFYARAKEAGVPVYVTGVYGGPIYESADLYKALGIRPLAELAPIAAYVKLWLLLTSEIEVDDRMLCPLAGDL